MLKKLQNLLFEDEDDDYIDDEDEEEVVETKKEKKAEQPVKAKPQPAAEPEVQKAEPAPVKPAAAAPAPAAPVQSAPAAPHVNRIDVTREIPVQEKKPAQEVKFPEAPKTMKREEKKSSINITVDDPYRKTAERKSVKPARPARKEKKPAKSQPASGYEFQPVISPIFGVDEKDMNALKTTTQKVASIEQSAVEDDSNITPVLSPIYGSTASLHTVTPEEERTGVAKEEPAAAEPANPTVKTPEEELNAFSLDDILKVRDQEYKDSMDQEDDIFPDIDFDDDLDSKDDVKPEDEIDQTLVIDKKKLRK